MPVNTSLNLKAIVFSASWRAMLDRESIVIRSKTVINWTEEKTTGTVPAGNFAARPSNTSQFQSQNQSQLLSSRASHFDGSRFRLDQNRGSGGHWLRNVKIAYCW